MAGEIVISEKPGDTLKKWRNIFKLSQKNLASLLNVKPSVVCDFEKGRRASPGIGTVRKFVEAMVEYDKAQGGKIVSSIEKVEEDLLTGEKTKFDPANQMGN